MTKSTSGAASVAGSSSATGASTGEDGADGASDVTVTVTGAASDAESVSLPHALSAPTATRPAATTSHGLVRKGVTGAGRPAPELGVAWVGWPDGGRMNCDCDMEVPVRVEPGRRPH